MKPIKGKPTVEGAGVNLHRIFADAHDFDPFLLLDDFSSDNKEDIIAGFPWHPHRGIETVTYIIKGRVEHGDSIGNKGVIEDNQVQWMTAGNGIIHEEMPKSDSIIGFQLWVNLPKKDKMMEPRYQDVTEFPVVEEGGNIIKVIAGKYKDADGPVKEIMAGIEYMDISVEKEFEMELIKGNTSFVYLFEGKGEINNVEIEKGALLRLEDKLNAKGNLRFLFVSGNALKEEVAWGGPIVMNTKEELNKAFEELNNGNFIKK